MSRRPLLLPALAAALAGLIVAVVVALAVPATRDAVAVAGPADPLAPAAPSARAQDPARPVVAAPLRPPRGSDLTVLRPIAPPRIEASAPDPLGGPRWAVRTFTADRFAGRQEGSGGLVPIGKPTTCAQLGRVLGGRFGWVDAANRWRPAAFGVADAPIACMRRGMDPSVTVTTRVSDPSAGAVRALNTVVWGMAGEPARVTATLDGRRFRAAATPHGAVLAVPPARARHPRGEIEVRYRDGREKRVGVSPFAEAIRHYRRSTGRGDGAERLLADPAAPFVIDYRVPDPDGGPPWGIAIAARRGGGWCEVGMGRVVGARVGMLDPRLGTFADTWPGPGCIRYPPLRRPLPPRRRPLTVFYGSASGGASEPAEERLAPAQSPERVVRRTLAGRTAVSGVAGPEVASVTIATPRDVRTVTPSSRARRFAVVYDGDFPVGEIVVSARLRDGSVHREPPFRGWF